MLNRHEIYHAHNVKMLNCWHFNICLHANQFNSFITFTNVGEQNLEISQLRHPLNFKGPTFSGIFFPGGGGGGGPMAYL